MLFKFSEINLNGYLEKIIRDMLLLLAICHYFFECYKVEYRLILSDRHHDKPPIRAAVGAVAGDERQKVVIAGYGHIILMQTCGLHKIHEARKIIFGFKIGFFRREIIIAHIERGEHFVGISAVQCVQMNRSMRLIERCFLVRKQRAEHHGRLGADIMTVNGNIAGRSAEAGIAGGKQRSQRAGRAGKAVLEIIGGKLRKALGIRNRAEKIVKSELIYN